MTGQDTVAGLSREVAGGITFLRRAGEAQAPTVLLLHGIGSNASSFAVDGIAGFDRCDRLECARLCASLPLADMSPSPRDYAAALALLDAIGLGRSCSAAIRSAPCLPEVSPRTIRIASRRLR